MISKIGKTKMLCLCKNIQPIWARHDYSVFSEILFLDFSKVPFFFFFFTETSKISRMKPHLLRISASNPQVILLSAILLAAAHSKHCDPVKIFLCWVDLMIFYNAKLEFCHLPALGSKSKNKIL